MRGNIRRFARYRAFGAAQISWTTGSGEARSLRVRCLDVSERGLRLESIEMIPVRALVTVKPEQQAIEILGQGSVRYCVRARGLYHVGVEFPGAALIFDRSCAAAMA